MSGWHGTWLSSWVGGIFILAGFQDLAEKSHSLPHPILATVLFQGGSWTPR